MKSLPKIFYQVCTERFADKYDLSKPFLWGGYVYATNGHVMVRAREDAFEPLEPDEPGRKILNPTIVTAKWSDREGFAINLPDVTGTTQCKGCDGAGTITDSTFECETCGEQHTLTLKGQPITFDCAECNATGRIPNREPLQVHDDPLVYLMPFYVAMLREAGIEEVTIREQDKALTFTGDGFEGWLMPMDTKTVLRELKNAEHAKAGA